MSVRTDLPEIFGKKDRCVCGCHDHLQHDGKPQRQLFMAKCAPCLMGGHTPSRFQVKGGNDE